ncbi:thymopoietin a isoform X2 [Hypomesus transpacificus]|uniref:thymopoietin a isoform X2 n=1 Tax=Hypomesus transpacificus TaxID=137520 RepID=UPI001F078632|nr:thymopoietin a isoform X2 [Hypomesus transpacificus]
MPEYLEDPSVLTKDKLKSELLANNVALPSGDQRKDVYVQLYLKSLTVQNKKNATLDAFSSDEELPTPVVSNKSRSGRKATRKTDKPSPEDLDVTELTSEGLKDELLKYGVNAGPIVASTRKLYERKLQKLLDQGPPELVVTSPVVTEIDSNHNGNSDSDRYSDKEEEETPAPEPVPEPVPVPVVERPVRSRGKTPVTTRTHSSQHNRVEKIAAGDQTSRRDEGDLKEMFPNNVNTPTGINATCRQPIRGAAGRPLKSSDLWLENSLLHSPRETTSTSSYRESHVVHRVTSLPPPPSSFSSSSFSSSRLVSAAVAPPAVQPKARRGLSMWLQLLLLSALAGFLFFVYQAMETNAISPFGGSSSSGSAQVGSDSTADVPSK